MEKSSEREQYNAEEDVTAEEEDKEILPEQTETAYIGENEPDESEYEPKSPRKISLFSFITATVSLIVAAVMITYTVSTAMYRRKLANVVVSDATQNGAQSDPSWDAYAEDAYLFDLISQFFEFYSFEDIDDEQMRISAIKAFVAATGDRHAYYFTPEEIEAHNLSAQGQNEGVGINIVEYEADIYGTPVKCMKIINVVKDSPADKYGLTVGDLVYGIGIGEEMIPVDSVGYSMALSMLVGKKGTTAEFTVIRNKDGVYEEIPCEIVRETVTEDSVLYRVHSSDPTVGIVKITSFDLVTPKQFSAAMDALISKGCTNFVFDVRNNLGGDVLSIKAILSYFLNEGDIVMRTEYKSGFEEFEKVGVSSLSGSYELCSVSASDIGKYSKDGYQFAVLCNGYTASAAELFTATFRDYNLGKIVGTRTYGKGSMQTLFNLESFGCEGSLKLTVAKYFSAANGGYNDGYDGVGITPDVVEELNEELWNKSIYLITDEEDNQLAKALDCFTK